jgi:hypothetical protein
MTCSNATTPPPPSAGRTTGCATGTPKPTPATLSAAGWKSTGSRSSYSPRNFAVSWTNDVSERGVKAAKRHQAVSGYWHSLATLARWYRLHSFLGPAPPHGITALDAIGGNPWLPPLPANQPTPIPRLPRMDTHEHGRDYMHVSARDCPEPVCRPVDPRVR